MGQYLAPIPSAEGEKINWINYKTGEKDIRFLMTADGTTAKISIVFSHGEIALQKKYFDKQLQLKNVFHQVVTAQWHWIELGTDRDGRIISEIAALLHNVKVLDKNDWPPMITFFKTHLIELDKFWCEYKFAFERSGF